MNSSSRRMTFLLGFSLIAVLLLGSSLAQAQMREITGRIDRISKKRMIVDNRMGDKVSFVPAENTEVTGEEKTEWKELKKKDWVTVSWKFVDKPRKAYKIQVLPPKEDD